MSTRVCSLGRWSPFCCSNRNKLLRVFVFVFLLCSTANSNAQTYIWSGGGTTTNWSDQNNWQSFIPPFSSPGESIVFQGTSKTTNTQDISSDLFLNNLSFNSGAGNFSISGGMLDFRTSLSNTAPTLVDNAGSNSVITLNTPINANNTLTISGSSTGSLILGGPLSGNGGLINNSGASVAIEGTGTSPNSLSFLAVNSGSMGITSGSALSLSATGSTGFGGNSSLFVEGDASFAISGILYTSATPQVHNTGQIQMEAGSWINSTAGNQNEIRIGYAGGTSVLGMQYSMLSTGGLRLGDAEFSQNPGHGLIVDESASTITAETLTLDDTSGSILIDDSQLNVDTFNCVQNGTVISLGDGASLNVGANNGSSSFSDTLHDLAGSITPTYFAKYGTGTLTITSANSGFSGEVDLNAGAIAVANDAALGTGTITANGGSIYASGANHTISNPISLTSGDALTISNATGDVHNLSLSGGISGSGGLTVTAPGSTITLSGSSTNTFTGPTSVTAGTLTLSKSGTSAAINGTLSIGNATNPGAADSAVVNMDGPYAYSASSVTIYADGLLDQTSIGDTIKNITLAGGELRAPKIMTVTSPITVTANATTSLIDGSQPISAYNGSAITYNVARGTATYDLNVTGSLWFVGDQIKSGAGIMRLGDSPSDTIGPNYYYTLSAGTIALASDSALGTTGDDNPSPFYLSGGTLVADSGDRTVPNPVSLTANSTIGSSLDGTPRAITFTAPLTVVNSATLTNNNNAATIFGDVSLGSNRLTIAGNSDTTISGQITDSGGNGELVKSGSGTLSLTNTNSFGGGLLVTGGAVVASDDTSLGLSDSPVTLINGSTLTFSGSTDRTFNLSNSTLIPASGGLITYSYGATVNGGALGAGYHNLGDGSSFNGARAAAGSVLVMGGGTIAFNNVLLADNSTLTDDLGATLNITGDFTTTPQTSMDINGVVHIAGGSLTGGLTIEGTASVANTTSPLYLDGSTGTIVKSGGTLSAATGSTIELGGLLVNNGSQNGVLNVNLGGLVKGSGTFGAVNVNSGGKFSPGNSPGVATVADLTLSGGSNYQFDIEDASGTPGNGLDDIQDEGTLDLTGSPSSPITVDVVSLTASDQPGTAANFDASKPYTFELVNAAGGIAGFDPSDFAVDTSEFRNSFTGSFSVAENGDSLDLVYTPTPEPGALLLVCLAAPTVLLRRRRFAVAA